MQTKPAELTDQELLAQAKKTKTTAFFDALIFGMLAGIAAYGSVKNGFGILTFLPLVYIPIATRNKAKGRAIENELKARNLK